MALHRGRPSAVRTPLMGTLQTALALAARAEEPGGAAPAAQLARLAEERERRAALGRRELLQCGAAAAAGLAAAGLLHPRAARAAELDTRRAPRIVIVGAGLAGLNAAYRLRLRGLRARVFEAGERPGGRVHTARGVFGPGLTSELGGEFIDSGHEEMLSLARRFGLELIDTRARTERDLVAETYFFDGQRYSLAEIAEAFRPLVRTLRQDYNSTSEVVDFRHSSPLDRRLDRMSIPEYLTERLGATGVIRKLLEVAYLTEYGRETGEQSALNLLFLIGTRLPRSRAERPEFHVFGESDERYKIRGGNARLVAALAERLRGQIRYGCTLEAIQLRGRGFRLAFARPQSARLEVDADILLLCLPFTVLREVDISLPLPDFKRRAINELGYGQNTKVLVGTTLRVWRRQGFAGNAFTDERFQSGWDGSRQQRGAAGSYTCYTGGNRAVELSAGTPEDAAASLLPGLERVFPGTVAAFTGRVLRAAWNLEPLARASYAAYAPGQWTTIAGAEILPVGNLFFAGEHCSYDYQGYMNGAAVTGRAAAGRIARLAGR